MKEETKTKIRNIIVFAVAVALFGIIIYPLLDLFVCKVFTHSEFVYSVRDHIIQPIVLGIISSLLFEVLFDRKTEK